MANAAWKRINRLRSGFDKQYTPVFERSLRVQIEPTIKALGGADAKKVMGKLDKLIKEAPLKPVFVQSYTDVGTTFARGTFNQVTGKAKKNELDDIWLQELLDFVKRAGASRITSITLASKEQAARIINRILTEQTFPEGLSVFQTRKLIQKEFTEQYIGVEKPFTITGRARTIAQTEVLTASNKGSIIGAESAGATKKVWLTSLIPDPEGNSRHVGWPGLHGQKRKIKEDHDVRGSPAMFPGDPTLPPEESVNCKCAQIFE